MASPEFGTRFFLQLALVLSVCRFVGFVSKKMGQPQVAGEIIAGVMMGPSLFGLLLPDLQSRLFPNATLSIIHAFSQLGLVLYMFLMGLEFRVDSVQRRLRSAASVSLVGILMPFILGSLIALFLSNDHRFFGRGISTWDAMLFLGAAMSVTAFPVLARIIDERGLSSTPLGMLALAAGSIDDAVAWCLLALVLASSSGEAVIAAFTVGGGLLYVLSALFIGRPLLRQLGSMAERNNGVSRPMLTFVLVLLMLAAWYTNLIGIYEVFGAFILGVVMPRGIFARDLKRFLEPLTVNCLLPLFFIYSGLNTAVALIDTVFLWVIALAILLAACLGKGIACWLTARLNGESQPDAVAIGALMNARGLMELVLLNVGLEHGIIMPTLFTITVFMAIATTLMAVPVLEIASRRKPEPAAKVVLGSAIGTT